jgi:hypothetical protein
VLPLKRLLLETLVFGAFCASAGFAHSADLLRVSRQAADDSTPIVVDADGVMTWNRGNQHVYLLKGNASAQQGGWLARMENAVVWVDWESQQKSGVLRVEIYAEGNVGVQEGSESKTATMALLELRSRGAFSLKSPATKVVNQPLAYDPLYRRALAEIGHARPIWTPVVEETSAKPASEAPGTVSQPPVTPAQWQAPAREDPPPAGAVSPSPGTYAPAPQPAPIISPPPASVPAPPVLPTIPGPALQPAPVPAAAPERLLLVSPRTSAPIHTQTITRNGEQALVVTGGIILTIRGAGGVAGAGLVDIEADRLIVWGRGNLQQLFTGLRSPEGQSTREVEFYLSGDVQIREQRGPESRTLRADEVYYDVGRNVAVARNANLELRQQGIPDPIFFKADEILKLNANQYQGFRVEIFSSRLPSDPGLKVYVQEATLDNMVVPKRTIFGAPFINRETGQQEMDVERLIRSYNVFLEVNDFPIFYMPFVQGDAEDPLGPLEGFNVGFNRVFGAQIFTTWDMYDLIGVSRVPGTRWKLELDYLTDRGPAAGTEFDYAGQDLFGIPGKNVGLLRAYGIYDTGTDILGGGRGENEPHPDWRGRLLWRHTQQFPADLTLQLQVAPLSDKNFLEQYFKLEFDRDINQETFAYLKQQRDNWAWTLLTEKRIRNWVTETEWLPRADAYLYGQSLFELLSYNVRADAGYGLLKPTAIPPPPYLPTDVATDTGRFDLFQELSLPFTLGPLRLAPYGVLDLAYYTNDLSGNETGRLYGGGGLRGSIPFSRLYPDVCSEYWNVNAIYHKIVLSGNYYIVNSDTSYRELPQLDRLNDDATDQALRDIHPLLPALNPANGLFLQNSQLYDPQAFAVRRLVMSRIDTLDSIQVLQADVRQRWQTKRGYPGMQHIIDWMTLDFSGSYFPDSERDNFGEPFAFLQYDWVWNIGDRTALTSTGWIDPIDSPTFGPGARVFTFGTYFNRPDRTNFYVGYRTIYPLDSQAITGAVNYIFSPKYALTGSLAYDFGTRVQTNSVLFTRMGSDLQVSLGFNYNSTINTFGLLFEIVPNLVPESRRIPGMSGFGRNTFGPQ